MLNLQGVSDFEFSVAVSQSDLCFSLTQELLKLCDFFKGVWGYCMWLHTAQATSKSGLIDQIWYLLGSLRMDMNIKSDQGLSFCQFGVM